MDELKHSVSKELMDLLIDRGRSKFRSYIKFKVALWEITVKMTYIIKRAMDIIFALCILIILSPVFIITAIAIKLNSSGPVIFKQVRVGKKRPAF